VGFTLLVTREQRTIENIDYSGDSTVTVGRSEDCEVQLESLNVSRRHCEVLTQGGLQLVRDLSSANGTFVNGQRITEHTLNPGDVISVGEYAIRYDALRSAPLAASPVLVADGALLTVQIGPGVAAKPAPTEAVRAVARSVAHLVVLPPAEPRTLLVRGATFLIGTAPNADLRLPDARAPRVAAALVRDGEELVVVDLSPRRNAVKLAGIPTLDAKLPPEALLEVAGLRLQFRRGLPAVEADRATTRVQRPGAS
jgi:pSer/pThr/pTyr-binding forkhead associated (FHA) protein